MRLLNTDGDDMQGEQLHTGGNTNQAARWRVVPWTVFVSLANYHPSACNSLSLRHVQP